MLTASRTSNFILFLLQLVLSFQHSAVMTIPLLVVKAWVVAPRQSYLYRAPRSSGAVQSHSSGHGPGNCGKSFSKQQRSEDLREHELRA